jgi:hypothetical protein
MRLRVCDGSPHRGRNKWSISVRRIREQWSLGIVNYMRVIGTINAGVSKTGYVAYVHCPVAVTQHDRRYNLLATLLTKVERFIYFEASLATL